MISYVPFFVILFLPFLVKFLNHYGTNGLIVLMCC